MTIYERFVNSFLQNIAFLPLRKQKFGVQYSLNNIDREGGSGR